MTLRDLISRCQQGESKAYKLLYMELSPYLMTTARRYVDRYTAEDLLQESFIQIFKSIHKVDLDAVGKGNYFHKIVINNCLKHIRKQKISIKTTQVIPGQAEPYTLQLSNFEIKEIMAMVDQLPEACRIVFYLYEVDGYSHAEIGSQLEIAPSTSRAHLTRAKKLLKKKLSTKTEPQRNHTA